MALVRIADIQIQTRHVELRPVCPECGEPTRNGVNEINLGDSYIDGKLEVDDSVASFEPDSSASWEYGETFIVVGYRCSSCHYVLVSGDESEVEID